MGAREAMAFLSHLATERDVATATQHQALSALLFLYKQVLEADLPWLDNVVRCKKTTRLPTVLSIDEVEAMLLQAGRGGAGRARGGAGAGWRVCWTGWRGERADVDIPPTPTAGLVQPAS